MLDQIQETYSEDKEIYFHRSTLALSREGRPMELLTVTSHDGVDEEEKLELSSEKLFPLGNQPKMYEKSIGWDDRSILLYTYVCRFSRKLKKYVFISARVHPGEVPGSHVFNGMLDLLLDKTDLR